MNSPNPPKTEVRPAGWVIQTAVSYFIGEPVYNYQEKEPDELTKRTCARYFPVFDRSYAGALEKEVEELRAHVGEHGCNIVNVTQERERLRSALSVATSALQVVENHKNKVESQSTGFIYEYESHVAEIAKIALSKIDEVINGK